VLCVQLRLVTHCRITLKLSSVTLSTIVTDEFILYLFRTSLYDFVINVKMYDSVMYCF